MFVHTTEQKIISETKNQTTQNRICEVRNLYNFEYNPPVGHTRTILSVYQHKNDIQHACVTMEQNCGIAIVSSKQRSPNRICVTFDHFWVF